MLTCQSDWSQEWKLRRQQLGILGQPITEVLYSEAGGDYTRMMFDLQSATHAFKIQVEFHIQWYKLLDNS